MGSFFHFLAQSLVILVGIQEFIHYVLQVYSTFYLVLMVLDSRFIYLVHIHFIHIIIYVAGKCRIHVLYNTMVLSFVSMIIIISLINY